MSISRNIGLIAAKCKETSIVFQGNSLESESYWDLDSVIFVQPTPGEILKKKAEAIVLNAGFKIKVVERGGRSVHSILQRSDVNPQLSCDWGDKCFICSTKPTGLCREESVGYKITCVDCEAEGRHIVMHGETAKTARLSVSACS